MRRAYPSVFGCLTRRKLLACAAAGSASLALLDLDFRRPGVGVTVAEAATPTSQQTNATRAVSAYNAMQKYFYVQDGTSLYREMYPWNGGTRYSYLWEFSRALIGTLCLAGVPSSLLGRTNYRSAVQDRFKALGRYWDSAASIPAYASYVLSQGGGDKYYDDNAWVALAQVQQYRMGLNTSLDRVKQVFSFATSGWDRAATDPYPGGAFWVQQGTGFGLSNHDRGTGGNGGHAEVGFHLHELTGSTTYDGDGTVVASPASVGAANMFNWVNTYLDSSRTGTGLYWNAVRQDTSIDTNFWSYNEGVMIAANVLRYRLTANSLYLQQAQSIATKTLSTYGNFTGQPPSFNAMCFEAMLLLSSASSDSTLKSNISQTIQAYGDWAWNNTAARDPKTNLFYFTDAGAPALGSGQAAQLRDQGAMTQLYALLAWNSTDYPKLT
jgi:Glycosyl hydrolase family 76